MKKTLPGFETAIIEEYPTIISASRRTDIPAFYSEWFLDKLKRGFFMWRNPFNFSQIRKISLLHTRLFVFWSKYPLPMLRILHKIEEMGYNFYFLFTLNDYPREIEPLPNLENRIFVFKMLSDEIGPEKNIWRFDPIMLTKDITRYRIVQKFERIIKAIHKYTNRVIVSFITLYSRVEKRLKKHNVEYVIPNGEDYEYIGKNLKELAESYGLEIQSCAMPPTPLEKYIKNGKCIDDELILKLFPKDHMLKEYIMKISKDKGQRNFCNCIKSVDIGEYNSCGFSCIYCYANHSNKKFKKINPHQMYIKTKVGER